MSRLALIHNGRVLIPDVEAATSLPARMRGLLGRDGLPAGAALLLDPCPAIHTWGMRFRLDVIFLSAENEVVRIVRDLRPWEAAFGGPRAARVVEMQAGWFDAAALAEGDRVDLVPAPEASTG